MAMTPTQGIGALLVAITAVGLLLTLRKLRGVPARSLRSKLLGGLVPVGATAAYVVLGFPPYNLTVLGGAAVVGLVLGLIIGRGGGRPMNLESHQRGLAVLLWSLVLVLAGLASLTPYGGVQAVATVALVATAGFAAGVQLGILARPRFRGTRTGIGSGSGAAATGAGAAGAAPLALVAMLGLLLAAGPWAGIASAQGEQPDPCTFMDVTIWPGPVLDPPGVLRGSDLDRPSCTAGFKYDTDDAGFILVGTVTVIQLPTEAEARASVVGAGAVLGQTAVELGDGGVEGLYLDGSEQGYAAYFSVHNYIGWVQGQADSDKRIQQARAAAGRLAELMQAAIAGPVEPSPTPEPTLAPTPVPTAAPSATAPAPSFGSETEAPATPAPTGEPTTPSGPAVDLTAILTQVESLGQSVTLSTGPVTPQLPEIGIQGIGAALGALIVGLVLARFGSGSAGPKPGANGGGQSGGNGGAAGSPKPAPLDAAPTPEPALARWPEDAEPIS